MNTRQNIKGMLVIFCALFLVLCIYLVYIIGAYGTRWFSSPYNSRLNDQKNRVIAGDILDRTAKSLRPPIRTATAYTLTTAPCATPPRIRWVIITGRHSALRISIPNICSGLTKAYSSASRRRYPASRATDRT